MHKSFICLVLVFLMSLPIVALAKSTDKPEKTDTLIKNEKKLQKLKRRKTKYTRDLEFLNHRLEVKKNKLESMTSNSEKGEEE
ncbi:hypothetical protein IJ579_02860 [bacterium]|nr:hypothetical protein [bacterium]